MDEMSIIRAVSDGRKAYKEGKDRSDCPLTDGRLQDLWIAGWNGANDAEVQKEEEQALCLSLARKFSSTVGGDVPVVEKNNAVFRLYRKPYHVVVTVSVDDLDEEGACE